MGGTVASEARTRALMALAQARLLTKAVSSGITALIALLTVWYASPAAITAAELPERLVDALVAYGLDRQSVIEAGRLTCHPALTGRTRHGSPLPRADMTTARRVATEEPELRARFTLAAAQRLTDASDDLDLFEKALAREQVYLAQHVAAGRKRRAAARRLDDIAAQSTTGWLVWRTVMDKDTTPDCAALNGRLFTLDNAPGLPGAQHFRCRCRADVWGGVAPGP